MMKKSIFSLLAVLISLLAFSISMPPDLSEGQKSELKTSPQDSSNEAFDKMMQVLMHQRCVNCHPAGDVPIKGEDSHVTRSLGISGGEKGHGLKSINCQTCHTDENNDFSGVPGAPHWALAPKSMAWEGKTRVEIATQMMDPKLNGGRSAKEIMEHLTEHELVLWAWDPGVDAEGTPRETPPVSKDEYIAAVKEWINKGAIIPNK